mmetsp:Transcript_31451/g.27812  ORF Transcript_31451/g.27812 Transcript_31451/m.27812 type:complete len:329 (-) Transcript_31451:38-1024(-)
MIQKVVVDLDEPEDDFEEETPFEILNSFSNTQSQLTMIEKETPRRNSESIDSSIEISEKFQRINKSIDNMLELKSRRQNKLRQEYKTKKKEVKDASKFFNQLTKVIQNEVVSTIDEDEIEEISPKFVDKGERIRHRSTSNSVLARVCKSSQREQQPVLWERFSKDNRWYQDDCKYQKSLGSNLGIFTDSNLISQSPIANIKQVQISLQPKSFTPKASMSKPEKSYFSLHKNRFSQKQSTNLKYFTSKLSEIPGPVTDNMKSMRDVRKNSTINKTYDEKLYGNTYKIDGSTKLLNSPMGFPNYQKRINHDFSFKGKYNNEFRRREFIGL